MLQPVTLVAADHITPASLHRRSCLAIDAGDASRQTSCKCSAWRTFDRRLPLGHQPAPEEEAETTCKEGGPPSGHRKCAEVIQRVYSHVHSTCSSLPHLPYRVILMIACLLSAQALLYATDLHRLAMQ